MDISNEEYLAAALTWIRLKMEEIIGPKKLEVIPAEPEKSSRPFLKKFFGGRDRQTASKLLPLSSSAPSSVKQAFESMEEAAKADPVPSFIVLSDRFGLSRFEQEVLLLSISTELDSNIGFLCAQFHNDYQKAYPTFSLAFTIFDNPSWDALSPEGALRYWKLIEISQQGAHPLIASALKADERILNFARGLNYFDQRLTPLMIPFDIPVDRDLVLPASQQEAVENIFVSINQATKTGSLPVTQLAGIDNISKQLVALRTTQLLNVQLKRLPVELLPSRTGEIEMLARLWQRECVLLPVALFVDAHLNGDLASREGAPSGNSTLNRFLSRNQGLIFVSVRNTSSGLSLQSNVIEIDKPLPVEQYQVWDAELDEETKASAPLLASQFNLNVTTIRDIVQRSASPADEKTEMTTHERLWEACLISTRPEMDRLAERLNAKATWDDIVLPDEDEYLLRQLTLQMVHRSQVYDTWGFREKMNRGFGINALFAGESGTGKTMAAEVIANHLNLNLYRIDLSAVVSKYIGETEKNLRRLFDAAEDGGAILFFDEADALFGKRSEVKDSHDRYANIEINYLLQRMEGYNGLAILATNMKNALDKAFLRRLRFVITFPFPGKQQRRLIWEKVWPSTIPTSTLDYDHLARFNLTGGSIKKHCIKCCIYGCRTTNPGRYARGTGSYPDRISKT